MYIMYRWSIIHHHSLLRVCLRHYRHCIDGINMSISFQNDERMDHQLMKPDIVRVLPDRAVR